MTKEQLQNLKRGDKVFIKRSCFPHQVVVDIDGEDIITADKAIRMFSDTIKYRVSYTDVELDTEE